MMFDFLFTDCELIEEFVYEGNYGEVSGYAVVYIQSIELYKVYSIHYVDGYDIDEVVKEFKGDFSDRESAVETARALFDNMVKYMKFRI